MPAKRPSPLADTLTDDYEAQRKRPLADYFGQLDDPQVFALCAKLARLATKLYGDDHTETQGVLKAAGLLATVPNGLVRVARLLHDIYELQRPTGRRKSLTASEQAAMLAYYDEVFPTCRTVDRINTQRLRAVDKVIARFKGKVGTPLTRDAVLRALTAARRNRNAKTARRHTREA